MVNSCTEQRPGRLAGAFRAAALGAVGGVVLFGTGFRGFLQAAWRELTAAPGPMRTAGTNADVWAIELGVCRRVMAAGKTPLDGCPEKRPQAPSSLLAHSVLGQSRKSTGIAGEISRRVRRVAARSAHSFCQQLATFRPTSSPSETARSRRVSHPQDPRVLCRITTSTTPPGDHRPGRAWPMEPCSPPNPHSHIHPPHFIRGPGKGWL